MLSLMLNIKGIKSFYNYTVFSKLYIKCIILWCLSIYEEEEITYHQTIFNENAYEERINELKQNNINIYLPDKNIIYYERTTPYNIFSFIWIFIKTIIVLPALLFWHILVLVLFPIVFIYNLKLVNRRVNK